MDLKHRQDLNWEGGCVSLPSPSLPPALSLAFRSEHWAKTGAILNLNTYPSPTLGRRHRLFKKSILPQPEKHQVRFVSGCEWSEEVTIPLLGRTLNSVRYHLERTIAFYHWTVVMHTALSWINEFLWLCNVVSRSCYLNVVSIHMFSQIVELSEQSGNPSETQMGSILF